MVRKPEIPGVDDFIKGKEVKPTSKIGSFINKKSKKFPLDLHPDLDDLINAAVSDYPGKISKHDWIITAITEKIERDNS